MNAKQQEAYDAVLAGENVFITGPGGTGKSYLIEQIVNGLPKTMRVAITALTGCAAILLGQTARTLHSWAGIGLGREPADALAELIYKKRKVKGAYKSWLQTDMLIIDEISMMTPELFEKLDAIGRRLRLSSKPFGGIQLVLVGDFYQLPPIMKEGERTKFLFSSPLWPAAVHKVVQLGEMIRQTDPVFQDLLLAIRHGSLNEEQMALLKSRQGLDWEGERIRPTLLFPRRAEVDAINEANIAALTVNKTEYKVRTQVDEDAPRTSKELVRDPDFARYVEVFDKDAPYDTTLVLAEGAQVMLIYNMNIEIGLVNGSRGVVTGFRNGIPVVLFKNGVEQAIGWHGWQLDNYKGVSRAQIPLRLAYALTIHKCQGATLDCAMVDIGENVFEYGQAYVALSRVRSLDSLYIWSLNMQAIRTHPQVVDFYRRLGGS